MPADLRSARAKLARAREHVEALHAEFLAWNQPGSYSVRSEPEGRSTEHRLYLSIIVEPDVEKWGLMFGDFVHNLRSALDHVVYALAVKETGTDPPPKHKALAFVLLDDPAEWLKQQWRLPGLTPAMRAAVEAVQPYQTALPDHTDVLRILTELDNVDKHRTIRPVAMMPEEAGIAGSFTGSWSANWFLFVPLEHEATIATITCDEGAEMDNEQSLVLGIAIPVPHREDPMSLTVLAPALYGRVRDVIATFDQFF